MKRTFTNMIHLNAVQNALNINSLRSLLLLTRNAVDREVILSAILRKQRYNKVHRAPKKAKRPPRNNGNGNSRRALAF
jgi:hypothetical protein